MKNIGKTVRNGIGGLALVLSTACEDSVGRYEEFNGSFTNPVTDSTQVVMYIIQKDSTGKSLGIDVYEKSPYVNANRIARFEGATAESLYTRLVPKAFEAYRARKD